MLLLIRDSDMIMELLRREKNAGIRPDEDLDIFIKVEALLVLPFLNVLKSLICFDKVVF